MPDEEDDNGPGRGLSGREALQQKYELVIRASTDAFWDWDPNTDEITRSEEYLAEFGYDAPDSQADTDWWRDRIHPDDRERVLSVLREAVAHPEATYDETYRFRRKDGTYGHLRSRGYVVYDEDGEPERMVGAHMNITEHEERERSITDLHSATRAMIRAETKREVAEIAVETARDIVDLSLTSIQLYDENADVLRPVAYTDGVEELFDDVPEIERGDGLIWRAFSAGDVEVHSDVRDDPATMNPGTVVRSQVILPLGAHGVLICNSTDVGDFGQIDVTLARLLAENTRVALNRIDQEESLRTRTRQLEQQNERLEEFASIVSHDLRNPLNVAEGRLELGRAECDSEHLDDVARALDRMNALIDDLLTLARQGDAASDVEPVDLAALGESCWRNVETTEARLVTETDETIRADRTRLQQLLENLFRNAVDHGGDDVTVVVGDLDDGAGFYVADDGAGIPEGERERIFQRGYSTAAEGTGFGLAIVEEIAQAHDWEIRVTDSDDATTRFEITGVAFTG